MKRMGIEGIYLGGWATSAKGSIQEDPGADLASYPLSQVPDEASAIVRALLTADRNQTYQRSRLSAADLASAPEPVDYRPFIIADADTGHGGDAAVRNLIRRFVEVGVTGYHIEDQRPGTKKCGHQGGKVLVGVDEQIKRLNAARFQLDVMRVPGIIVARTDAEAANLLDNSGDERDHPFILGATRADIPSYKLTTLALMRVFYNAGAHIFNGFTLYKVTDKEYAAADAWLDRTGIAALARAAAKETAGADEPVVEQAYDKVANEMVGRWEAESGLMTIGEAVLAALKNRVEDGDETPISEDEWSAFAATASFWAVRTEARELGIDFYWDAEVARTPEGFYQVRGGLDYAIRKSLSVAPYADLVWMETASADIHEAQEFAEAIHAEFPDKMLAYNLSPSFNWDSTGMTDDEMREFPKKLGEAGFVFNFITYGGHQIDGVATEEFATALLEDGMLALAQVQRKIRLLESPYRTPQTHVGGPRLDAALAASSARTATTKAMGKGSTQVQHLAQTELPKKVLEDWLAEWTAGLRHQGAAHGTPAPEPRRRRRTRTVGAGHRRRRRPKGQPRLRSDHRPPWTGHPVGPGPEHVRLRTASEAPDDPASPLRPQALPGHHGPLRHTNRGQRQSDQADGGAGHLLQRKHRGGPDHRRHGQHRDSRHARRRRGRSPQQAHPQGELRGRFAPAT